MATTDTNSELSRRSPKSSFSARIWGLSWPILTVDGVTVNAESFAEALPFMTKEYPSIFGHNNDNQSRFLAEPMTDAKRRFCDEMDVLVFRDGARIVGVMMGHPVDWSTYYWRTIALLPEMQERRIATRVLELTDAPLRAAGVARLEGECLPGNLRMVKMLTGQGYLVTSTVASERFGVLLRLTKFLVPEARAVFDRQFSSMSFVNPQPSRRLS